MRVRVKRNRLISPNLLLGQTLSPCNYCIIAETNIESFWNAYSD